MTERVTITDPYKVLQVDPEAEDEVIEAAYRRLARKYHPDVSPDPESQERMVRINQAWELLRDPVRRAAVDRARARANAARSAGPGDRRAPADTDPRPQGGQPPAARRPDRAPEPRGGAAPGAGTSGATQGAGSSGAGRQSPRAEQVSRDWTSGRSTSGSTYSEASLQGEGVIGPPPGNPSGSVLNFGRYSGWSLGEIGRTEPEYLEWLDRMPIGRSYQQEIDTFLRRIGRRTSGPADETDRRGFFRRR